jgi:hypothetical protein
MSGKYGWNGPPKPSVNFVADPANKEHVNKAMTASGVGGAWRRPSSMLPIDRPVITEVFGPAPPGMVFPPHALTPPPLPPPQPRPVQQHQQHQPHQQKHRESWADAADSNQQPRSEQQHQQHQQEHGESWADAADDVQWASGQQDGAGDDEEQDDAARLAAAEADGSRVCHTFFFRGSCFYGDQCRFAHLSGGPGEEMAAAREVRQQRLREMQEAQRSAPKSRDRGTASGWPRGARSGGGSASQPIVSNNGKLPNGRIISGDEWRKANIERQRLESRMKKQQQQQQARPRRTG